MNFLMDSDCSLSSTQRMIFFGRIGSPRSEANGFTPVSDAIAQKTTHAAWTTEPHNIQFLVIRFGRNFWRILCLQKSFTNTRPNTIAVKHEYCGGLWSVVEKNLCVEGFRRSCCTRSRCEQQNIYGKRNSPSPTCTTCPPTRTFVTLLPLSLLDEDIAAPFHLHALKYEHAFVI